MITFSLLLQDAVVRGWGCGRWDDGIQIGEEGNREVGKRQSKNRTMKSWVGVGMWVGARGELVLEMLWVCSPISLTQHVQRSRCRMSQGQREHAVVGIPQILSLLVSSQFTLFGSSFFTCSVFYLAIHMQECKHAFTAQQPHILSRPMQGCSP